MPPPACILGALHAAPLCRRGLASDFSLPEDQEGHAQGSQAQQPRLTLGPWSPWDPDAWTLAAWDPAARAAFPLGNKLQQQSQGPRTLRPRSSRAALHCGENSSRVDESVFSPSEEGVGVWAKGRTQALLVTPPPVCDRGGPRGSALLPAGPRTPIPWGPKILPRALPHLRV